MPVPARSDAEVPVTVGVAVALDLHVAVALDHMGRRLDELTVPTTEAGTKFALRSIARRYRTLSEEIRELDGHLARLVTDTAPALLAVHGVDTAATLLVAVGQDPKRLKSEAAFAHMCGVAPIPASSGKVVRHCLNRRGNRDANRALHVVAAERLSRDERTRAYAERRTAEGKSRRETMRCLKRYIARELYKILVSPVVPTAPLPVP